MIHLQTIRCIALLLFLSTVVQAQTIGFEPFDIYPGGTAPEALVVDDFNNDTILDVVFANTDFQSVVVAIRSPLSGG